MQNQVLYAPFVKASDKVKKDVAGAGKVLVIGGKEKAVVIHHMDQTDAKKSIPKGAFVWRDNKRKAWCAHYPISKNRRISEAFSKYGGSSQIAWESCLRQLWQQYIDFNGLTSVACPFKGLVADGD